MFASICLLRVTIVSLSLVALSERKKNEKSNSREVGIHLARFPTSKVKARLLSKSRERKKNWKTWLQVARDGDKEKR
ncbi:hypothetical protein F5H01DRAFT_346136 [Linnemannia elongata]|nr:hypothetical protein F5H01DRAFT_346136 [Linnemannia elongata]